MLLEKSENLLEISFKKLVIQLPIPTYVWPCKHVFLKEREAETQIVYQNTIKNDS